MSNDEAYVQVCVLRNKFWSAAKIPHECRRSFWWHGGACFQGGASNMINDLFDQFIKNEGFDPKTLRAQAAGKKEREWVLEDRARGLRS